MIAPFALTARQKVYALLQLIVTTGPNPYFTPVVTISQRWENFLNLTNNKLPAIFVSNEADDLNTIEAGKFSSRYCNIPGEYGINIMGRLMGAMATGSERPEDLIEKFVEDVERALLTDPTLGKTSEMVKIQVRRQPPWTITGNYFNVQIMVTYRATVKH